VLGASRHRAWRCRGKVLSRYRRNALGASR
jgi:hypothetical protein